MYPPTSGMYAARVNILVQAARAIIALADTVNIDELRDQLGQLETIAPKLRPTRPTTFMTIGDLSLVDQRVFLEATATYVRRLKLLDRRPRINCPDCGRTSHHPTDVAEGYCGNCHEFTSRTGPT